MKYGKYTILALSVALAVSAASISGCGGSDVQAQTPVFTLSSTDLASSPIPTKFVLHGFGCTGQNISPALQWSNKPAGTLSFALQLFDPDAPSGRGFWHWAVYDIPPTTTELDQGAGNSAATLPPGSRGGNTDFFDTGATGVFDSAGVNVTPGVNGTYGGPCPPVGDAPHHYTFTLYALDVPKLDVAAGVPLTGTAGLYGFALGRGGIGPHMLAKAQFIATFGR